MPMVETDLAPLSAAAILDELARCSHNLKSFVDDLTVGRANLILPSEIASLRTTLVAMDEARRFIRAAQPADETPLEGLADAMERAAKPAGIASETWRAPIASPSTEPQCYCGPAEYCNGRPQHERVASPRTEFDVDRLARALEVALRFDLQGGVEPEHKIALFTKVIKEELNNG